MQRQGWVVIVMGVAGSGKTTVGQCLAQALGTPFYDADDYHSEANKEKMRRGHALDDADRAPWLAALRKLVVDVLEGGGGAVLACSALKERYRAELRVDPARVRLVYLKGSAALIERRLRQRAGHYASVSLLQSQFATLEEPSDALEVDAALPPAEIVAQVVPRLKAGGP